MKICDQLFTVVIKTHILLLT